MSELVERLRDHERHAVHDYDDDCCDAADEIERQAKRIEAQQEQLDRFENLADEKIDRLEEWIVELNGFRTVAANLLLAQDVWPKVVQAAFDRSDRPADLQGDE